jgi:hypothetical protein
MERLFLNRNNFDGKEISNHVRKLAGKETFLQELIPLYKEVTTINLH